LGKDIINVLNDITLKAELATKIVLFCKESNVKFYEKLNY